MLPRVGPIPGHLQIPFRRQATSLTRTPQIMKELAAFAFVDREHFEVLARFPIRPTYRDILQQYLPVDWEITKFEIYLYAHYAGVEMPDHGFKIHVSGTTDTADEILHKVVPYLVAQRVSFKIVSDPILLNFLNSKRCARGSSGKFVTIYPPDLDTFQTLIEDLRVRTDGIAGPYILSDQRYRDSKAVFYRYGGFRTIWSLNPDGTKKTTLVTPDGGQVDDERLPYFHVPDWAEDPFASEHSEEREGSDLLNDRYEVVEALIFSNSGGVYKAIDQVTGRTVVIKEARPLTHQWSGPEGSLDAIAMLEREYAVLDALMDVPSIVNPVELFREWEHVFLVEEFMEGVPLSSFRAVEDVILVAHLHDSERVARFCTIFRTLAGKLVDAVEAIHDRGIIVCDLTPNNILVHPDTLDVTLIDFESAYSTDRSGGLEAFSSLWYTPGFRAWERAAAGKVAFEDDLYGLGMVLYSLLLPVQSLFELSPPARDLFVDRLVEAGLPAQVKDVIYSLLDGNLPQTRSTLAAWNT